MSDDDPSEVIVAALALVISVVALSATFMQVMQQYYASARGYSQCNDKVMGDWAKTKSRSFSWEELRFEVQFDAPVIFVCPPTNKNGPIAGQDIYNLDGTDESLKKTWTIRDMDAREEYAQKSAKERIHTADNERASWFVLLYAVQRMEHKSGEWQQKQYEDAGPPVTAHGLPVEAPSLMAHHTMTVALQRKRKSWDTMPSTMTKPYATTTICHLIEMMAALGVYWKEFDRKHDRYRAEGNGFMVLGERQSELGLIFSFQVYGKCHFGRNRVIPVDEVKELCFGHVPTIYRETLDQRRLEIPNDETQNLGSLQLATRGEIAETLVMIGCNNNTVRHFRAEGKRTSHLFPIAFEILGMLGRTLHIENSCYTYIPNPTPDRWDKGAVSLIRVLESFQLHYTGPLMGDRRNTVIVKVIKRCINDIMRYIDAKEALPRLLLLRALHTALDRADEVLTAKTKGSQNTKTNGAVHRPTPKPRDSEMTIEGTETHRQGRRREVVQDVLRAHIQEIVRQMERDDRTADNQSLHVPEATPRPPSPGTSRPRDDGQNRVPRPPAPRFEDLDEASPDERPLKFMDVYFEVIRPRVVHQAVTTTGRRVSMAGAPPGFGFKRQGTGRTQASASVRNEEIYTAAPSTPKNGPLLEDSDNEPVSPTTLEDEKVASLAELEVDHDDIWCTLVFRMICWLMLHDINKQDVQVSKSELLGSRMPVYIA
ncbi:hypothetical protein HJFPF1_09965 [Paramyrothecium foliicola]|nr:hypothetical protein HJFPF1_09965 [Paramyrothecium foliicola]